MADVIRKLTHTAAELDNHIDSGELHISEADRQRWNDTYSKAEADELLAGKVAKLSEDIEVITSATALNRSTLGYQRKNLLENIGTTDTKNGVTFIKNGDDSITANGTAVGGNATFRINNNFHLEPGRYVLSGCPQGGSGTGYRLQMSYLDYSFFGRDEGHGFIFEVTESAHFIISIIIQNGMTVSDLTFYPMIRFAEITDDTYEPYQPSVQEQLTDIIARLTALEGGEK